MTTIVGGVYADRCIEPLWNEVYGSAGRAAAAVSDLSPGVRLLTYLSEPLLAGIENLKAVYRLEIQGTPVPGSVEFAYTHTLAIPRITPRPDAIEPHPPLVADDDIVLRFGMLEGTARVTARRAVYDPQAAFDPRPFEENGSKADELALILNRREAACMTGHGDPGLAAQALLGSAGATVVVIKMGGMAPW
jgi:hypothetical protein